MNKKVLLFDLDGVLVDTKDLHYEAFNDALKKCNLRPISYEEHIKYYDGLSTKRKIEIYSNRNKQSVPDDLWEIKQNITEQKISKYDFYRQEIYDCFSKLKNDGHILGVCTNTIKKSAKCIIQNLQIDKFLDLLLTNQDVINPKPSPEIYNKAIEKLSSNIEDVYIFEDSPKGISSAKKTGGNIVFVNDLEDINYDNIIKMMRKPNYIDINILIPMAGGGTRFSDAGYELPKPLIEVDGNPMIQKVIENFNFKANFIFVVQKEHIHKYKIDEVLKNICGNCSIIEIDGITEGAAITCLKAKKLINQNKELIIANSDQFVDIDVFEFLYFSRNKNLDGSIITFQDDNTQWSYAKLDETDKVCEVAEKIVISNNASAGIYYYKNGEDFVKNAESMISKNIRTNNEFYVMPIFNEYINNDKHVGIFNIGKEKMWGLGTPEDLQLYKSSHEK